jgi:hypothetical protein
MKAKTTLLPILITALLCSNLFGSNAADTRQASKAGLPNPALVGIEAIRVVVVYQNALVGRDEWIYRNLGAMVERRLTSSDAQIAALIERGYSARYQNIPTLTINVDRIVLNRARPPVLYVRTSFSADVTLERNLSTFLRIELWTKAETIQAPSLQAEFTVVTSLVNKHIEQFASDFKQANSAISPLMDVNDYNNILPQATQQLPAETPKETPKTPVEKEKVEQVYIASKNSSVFHRPDCSWVGRILPKNRIEYKTREEAIQAGKKPCKKCKP